MATNNRPLQIINPLDTQFKDYVERNAAKAIRQALTLQIDVPPRKQHLEGEWVLPNYAIFPCAGWHADLIKAVGKDATVHRNYGLACLKLGLHGAAYYHMQQAVELSYYRLRPACGYNNNYLAQQIFLKYNSGADNV